MRSPDSDMNNNHQVLPTKTTPKHSIDTEWNLSSWIYDLVLWIFMTVLDIFFREIKPRGTFRIPRKGPLIFVAAPHANQFVDPIILMNQVKQEAGRRISFLIAEKSMKRLFIGTMARAVSAISVIRPQDNAFPGSGRIYIKKSEPTRVFGIGTKFTKECQIRGFLIVSSSVGSTDIQEIISDTELIVRKEFKGSKVSLLTNSDGINYKRADYVDQSIVYSKVFNKLHQGGCIGIFPEGGSHDRTNLLPLKAGVALMALGALAENPESGVQIVPCGFNYFHPHKFRSRAVIEFGLPFTIPFNLVEKYKIGGEHKREAVKTVLDMISTALKSVTLQVEDYDTLMMIQAIRRLYQPANKKIPLSMVVELNRLLLTAYNQCKDNEQISKMKKNIYHYNKLLQAMGLKDHQVKNARVSKGIILYRLIYRSIKLILLSIGFLPGLLLFLPIFIVSKTISTKKAKEALKSSTVKIKANDVIATWKVLVAMGLTPILYAFYSLLASSLMYKFHILDWISPFFLPFISLLIIVVTSYAALIMGEAGMDIFKSLRPLALALNPRNNNTLMKLQNLRKDLVIQSSDLVNSLDHDFVSAIPQTDFYSDLTLEKYTQDDYSNPFHHKCSLSGSSDTFKNPENVGDELVCEVRSKNFISNYYNFDNDYSISRVSSEMSLTNFPLFSLSRASSFSSLASQGDNSKASGIDDFTTEVNRRIALAMEQKRRQVEDY